MKSILDIIVSCFENCQNTTPHDVNLLGWLTSDKHRVKVEQLRAIQDESLQKVIKASLPAITPCGLFSYRDEKHLKEHSGFLVFDIDEQDNKHIGNFAKLKEQIANVVCVAYCGISIRGKGYWGLVPIPKSTPEEHRYRFAALSKFFKGYGIVLDESGKDICRLRIYSWDPAGYFNHSAKLYTNILKPQAKKIIRPCLSDTRTRVEAIILQIKENKIDLTTDYKEEWLKIASALANEFGESGRGYFHTVSMFHLQYSEAETNRMFDNVLKHNYSKVKIASFFKIASDHGIKAPLQKSDNNQKIDNLQVVKHNSAEPIQSPTLQESEKPIQTIIKPGLPKHGTWSDDIVELQRFFQIVKLPTEPVKLNECSMITDVSLFVESHLSFLKGQNGNVRYEPYLDRLNELKILLSRN